MQIRQVKARLSFFVALAALSSFSALYADNPIVTIEVTGKSQQTFHGFGASAGNTVGEFLPAGGRSDASGSVANSIYNATLAPNNASSLNLSYIRLAINADNYKMSSTAHYDFASAVLKTGQAAFIRAAKARNPTIKIFFSCWTPPYWMKENGASYNAGDPTTFSFNAKTTNHLPATQETAYAALLKQFCIDFKHYFGYPVDALSFQNEPDVNLNYYGCCLYPSSRDVDPLAATYTDTLTAVRNDFPIHSKPQLWGMDTTSSKSGNSAYIARVAAMNKLDALCVHDYGSDARDLPVGNRSGLPLNMSETCFDEKDFLVNTVPNQAKMAAALAGQFCRDANEGQVSTWFWWNMVGVNKAINNKPTDTGASLIIANGVKNPASVYKFIDQSGYPADHAIIALNNNTAYPAAGGPYESPWQFEFGNDWTLTSKYYALRRLSQSVVPGSVSLLTKATPIDTQLAGPQADVYSCAFKLPHNKHCFVIANQSSKPYSAKLRVDPLASTHKTGFKVYYTSQDVNGHPVNDTSWNETLTDGQETVSIYPYSVFCYVQN